MEIVTCVAWKSFTQLTIDTRSPGFSGVSFTSSHFSEDISILYSYFLFTHFQQPNEIFDFKLNAAHSAEWDSISCFESETILIYEQSRKRDALFIFVTNNFDGPIYSI